METPRTPSPSRRRPPRIPPSPGTPPSPTRSTPSVHSSPRRRRRREGRSTGSGAGRPQNLSRSVSPLHARFVIPTPPSSPDRLRAGTVEAGLADDGVADDGSREGSPRSSVGDNFVLRKNNNGDSCLVDDDLSAAGSMVEPGRVSTVYDTDDANARMLWSKEEGSIRQVKNIRDLNSGRSVLRTSARHNLFILQNLRHSRSMPL